MLSQSIFVMLLFMVCVFVTLPGSLAVEVEVKYNSLLRAEGHRAAEQDEEDEEAVEALNTAGGVDNGDARTSWTLKGPGRCRNARGGGGGVRLTSVELSGDENNVDECKSRCGQGCGAITYYPSSGWCATYNEEGCPRLRGTSDDPPAETYLKSAANDLAPATPADPATQAWVHKAQGRCRGGTDGTGGVELTSVRLSGDENNVHGCKSRCGPGCGAVTYYPSSGWCATYNEEGCPRTRGTQDEIQPDTYLKA